MRQVVLDTETTGLKIEEGHRIIEIGCVELINRKLSGKQFHYYLNPEKEVEAGALAVHGISNTFLKDKPLFTQIVKEFIQFIEGAELIIHNAAFDLAFLNYELSLLQLGFKSVAEYCTVVDTLPIARQLHVGQRNSLDALCKRYGVDNSKRDLHGALMDAHLLAQVYLAMTGGQGSFFDSMGEKPALDMTEGKKSTSHLVKQYDLTLLLANEQEMNEHLNYLDLLKKQGKCIWEVDV